MIRYVYIHIPFCVRKCIYCDFFSVPYDETLAARYAGALIRELDLRRGLAGDVQTVYIGGGTPTTLPAPALTKVMRAMWDHYRISPGAEISIEANPGTVNRETLRALADAGVNRLSIGVQSFDNDVLRLLGRIHTIDDILRAIIAARDSGFGNLSFDLIYGIPGQTPRAWSQTLSRAVGFLPEHISAYELTPEKGTSLHEMIAQGRLAKPDEDTIIMMYDQTIDLLGAGGYRHYEISNFAQPGFQCRHNLNYWDRGEYIGIGAGAHSFVGNRRTKTTDNIEHYIAALDNAELPAEEATEVIGEAVVRERLFLGLRKRGGIALKGFSEETGLNLFEAAVTLIEEGLLMVEGDYLRLTRRGITVSNAVFTKLFQLLEIQ